MESQSFLNTRTERINGLLSYALEFGQEKN